MLVHSLSFGLRVLVVVLKHSDKFSMAFVVGHFHNCPHERRAQWVALRERAGLLMGLPVVPLADHNSILSSLDSPLVNELAAMDAKCAALGSLGLFDAWVSQFLERHGSQSPHTQQPCEEQRSQ